MRELHITPVLNGFVVKVGCQTVVFRSRLELAEAITGYYANPGEFEARFIKDACNAKFVWGQPVAGVAENQRPARWEDVNRDLQEAAAREREHARREQQQRVGQGSEGGGALPLSDAPFEYRP